MYKLAMEYLLRQTTFKLKVVGEIANRGPLNNVNVVSDVL